MKDRPYLGIDLKPFYASVECIERGLDPLTTNLVVADLSRTEKTICLAVSPSLKAYGIPGRARLFEVIQKIGEENGRRRARCGGFCGESQDEKELKKDPALKIAWLTAAPRMALYLQYSARIHGIYLQYVAPEDIHVYSIDEAFLDVTDYLQTYRLTAKQLAGRIIREVLRQTGIVAAAGIGPNLYLCKAALDIVAKHVPADEDGVRIAALDEKSYRRLLWGHRPLTDFWRVGAGTARRLAETGLFTMGDVARCSLGGPDDFYNEDLLYRLLGVNAELLIDHAWGVEPCTIADIKAYRPRSNSLGAGQVLQSPHDFEKAGIVVREMADSLALGLVEKGLVTDQVVLTVGYDRESLKDPAVRKLLDGSVTKDRYGREIPAHAHGTVNLGSATSSGRQIGEAVMRLYGEIVNPALLIRRLNLTACHVVPEEETKQEEGFRQLELFSDWGKEEAQGDKRQREEAEKEREKKMQKAVLEIQKKFGKNAVLKGMSLQEGATARERNGQIGGHRA